MFITGWKPIIKNWKIPGLHWPAVYAILVPRMPGIGGKEMCPFMTLDREAKTPLSRQIVKGVVEGIENGLLLPGDKLPTERELAEELDVARGTVKNAYKKLERMRLVKTRQGSGSFIIRDEELTERIQRENASGMVAQMVAALKGYGMQAEEIRQLVDLALCQDANKRLNLAIIHDSPEILLDCKKQLGYLPGVSLSIFIEASVTEDQSPETLLSGFDVIVVPSSHYKNVIKMLPNLQERVIEAAISPANDTIIQLTALPRDARIGIICRTNSFLKTVRGILESFDFHSDRILSFFEMDYTVQTYFPGGIDALISYGDAHIFADPDFAFRNEEFMVKGGCLIAFHHQIERGTLIYIEDRVRQLLGRATVPGRR